MKEIFIVQTCFRGEHQKTVAFECRACAELLAASFRRERIPVTVIPVEVYSHLRGFSLGHDHPLPAARAGNDHDAGHVPAALGSHKKN